MPIDRRQLLAGLTAGAATYAISAVAAPLSAFGLDAAQFGVRPGSPDDQSRPLQRAINQAAQARTPLWLAPGFYRAGNLSLPPGAQLAGVRGATRLTFTQGPSLFSSIRADHVSLTGITLDGLGFALPEQRGLIHLNTTSTVRINDCHIVNAGGNAITLEQCGGSVTQTTITSAADTGVHSIDGRELLIVGNNVVNSGNNGIRVWQSQKRHDGSVVADNRIDDTHARSGGDGENGNAVNVFRAADVVVRNNTIRRAAFSAVRGNAADNIQVIGNNCAEMDETAMYAEFGFVGAVFADNVIDGAENGISVTNFDHGGRLGTVRGNIIRNVRPRRPNSDPGGAGVGISAEADTTVTGNVIEHASRAGVLAGWGPYLRDVTVAGNIMRDCRIGVMVSVAAGAGSAVITGNEISGARRGAVVGMEWQNAVTGDLTVSGAERYPQLSISGNHVR